MTRRLPPWAENQPGPNRCGYYNQYNQGKRSVLLDLKNPRGVEVAKELVALSDIVAENFAAGVMERLGLGYGELCKVKPDIIMISMSGYGATGPEKDYVSYGPAQVPLSGLSSITGFPGFPPMHVGFSYGDPNAGLHGAVALLCALMYRARTGKGQHIDLSQWETSIALVNEGLMQQVMTGEAPKPMGNRDPHMAPHGLFRCRGSDSWISIAVADEEEWRAVCRVMARSELADDARFRTLARRKANEDELESLITGWTETLTADEATALLQAEGVPAFAAVSNKDLAENPHLATREFFVELEHPEVGVRRHAGVPWKMSATPCRVRRPAPLHGADTDEVMSGLLGYSAEEIAALRERGVFA